MPDFGPVPELPDDDTVLREIAAMDLALARRHFAEAMAEPDPEKAAGITRAYNRVTRSLRQSIALRARLAQGWETHEARHGRRDSAVPATPDRPTPSRAPTLRPPVDTQAANQRRVQLMKAIPAIIWNERETEALDAPTAAALRNRFDHEIGHSHDDPDFGRLPLAAHIAEVCRRYGLTFDPDWTFLPEPPIFWRYPREPDG